MQKTITGSYFSATDTKKIQDLCAAYIDGRLPVDRLITKRIQIDEIQDAIDLVVTVEGRIVITF